MLTATDDWGVTDGWNAWLLHSTNCLGGPFIMGQTIGKVPFPHVLVSFVREINFKNDGIKLGLLNDYSLEV